MGCCYPGQNCMTLNGAHSCCPTNYQTCGNTMCTCMFRDAMRLLTKVSDKSSDGNSTCCASQPGKACGPEEACCGDGCCVSGYSCCSGAGGSRCCSNFGWFCCGSMCCSNNKTCCGEIC